MTELDIKAARAAIDQINGAILALEDLMPNSEELKALHFSAAELEFSIWEAERH